MLKSSCFVAMALMLATGLFCAAAHAQSQTNRVVIVLTNHAELGDTGRPTGFYLSEAAHPWHVFTEAGYHVVLASPRGGRAPMDPKSIDLDDSVNAAFLETYPRLDDDVVTRKVADLSHDFIDAVFIAGGHGTMFDLPEDTPLQALIAGVHGRGGVVAAVCHGPAALVNVRLDDGSYLVAGKRVAAFTNAEERAVELAEAMPFLLQTRLEERGAEVVEAANFEKNVVVDGRLVTGQNPASATGAAEAVVELLSGSE